MRVSNFVKIRSVKNLVSFKKMAPNSNPLKFSAQKIERPKILPVKISGYTVLCLFSSTCNSKNAKISFLL